MKPNLTSIPDNKDGFACKGCYFLDIHGCNHPDAVPSCIADNTIFVLSEPKEADNET